MKTSMWVFGYGSLIWKADFPYCTVLPGYIKGYCRRFYQGSEDHRGVPGKPGRVVTLIPSTDPEVWGVAYEICEDDESSVKAYLDYREKDGYNMAVTTFYPKEPVRDSFDVDIYVADETNPFYLGPASIDDIAQQILHAEGPSGRNVDYLLQLADAVRKLDPSAQDSHLCELEDIVRELMKPENEPIKTRDTD